LHIFITVSNALNTGLLVLQEGWGFLQTCIRPSHTIRFLLYYLIMFLSRLANAQSSGSSADNRITRASSTASPSPMHHHHHHHRSVEPPNVHPSPMSTPLNRNNSTRFAAILPTTTPRMLGDVLRPSPREASIVSSQSRGQGQLQLQRPIAKESRQVLQSQPIENTTTQNTISMTEGKFRVNV
jgi:hypothetical protein